MKRLARVVMLCVALCVSCGCARNYYNIPRDTFEKKVRVLGVAPVMVDADSDIRYPEKDALLPLLKEFSKKNDRELVAQCKSSGTFFLVQPLADDPDQLFSHLFFRREKRDDAGVLYNKYFFKGPELKELIEKNKVDALLVVIVSGLTKHGRRYAANLIHYLESDYNSLIMTAQLVDSEGTVLWEYPNFRQRSTELPLFMTLQYPDFDEANANETDKVKVHFRTVEGIKRALGATEKSSVLGTEVSSLYSRSFDDMVSLLKPEPDAVGWMTQWTAQEKKQQEAKPEEKPAATTTAQ